MVCRDIQKQRYSRLHDHTRNRYWVGLPAHHPKTIFVESKRQTKSRPEQYYTPWSLQDYTTRGHVRVDNSKSMKKIS